MPSWHSAPTPRSIARSDVASHDPRSVVAIALPSGERGASVALPQTTVSPAEEAWMDRASDGYGVGGN